MRLRKLCQEIRLFKIRRTLSLSLCAQFFVAQFIPQFIHPNNFMQNGCKLVKSKPTYFFYTSNVPIEGNNPGLPSSRSLHNIMKAIKLITFDATNTILKFKIPPWEHYALEARKYGYTGTGNDIKDQMLQSFKFMETKYPNFGKGDITWRVWWQKLVQLTFTDRLPPTADVTKMGTKLIDQFATAKCWNIAYGTPKLLEQLRDDGISLGVISNFDPRLNDILENVLLRHYFDFVLTSYEVGYSKPDPKIFSRALEFCKTPTTASEALHIGDDLEKDFNGAKNCGWHSILLKNPPGEIMDKISEEECVFPSIQALSDAYEQQIIKLKN